MRVPDFKVSVFHSNLNSIKLTTMLNPVVNGWIENWK